VSRPPVERWLIRAAVAEDCEEIMRLIKVHNVYKLVLIITDWISR